MSIGELGSIGEFVAAIATVITLVYLALQIRANTAAVKAESRRNHIAIGHQFNSTLASNTQAAGVFRRGLIDPRALEPDEFLQFEFQFAMLVSQAEVIYFDREVGIVDDAVVEPAIVGVSELLALPGGRAYWKRHSSKHRGSFARYLETKVEGLAEAA